MDIRPSPPFFSESACKGLDPDWWYPISSQSTNDPDLVDEDWNLVWSERSMTKSNLDAEKAKRICARCDVRLECLNYALEHKEDHGIWGGYSARARLRIRRTRLEGLPDEEVMLTNHGRPARAT